MGESEISWLSCIWRLSACLACCACSNLLYTNPVGYVAQLILAYAYASSCFSTLSASLLRPYPFRLLHMLQRETLCLLSCNSRVAEFGTEMKTWLLQATSEEGEKDEEASEVGTGLLAQ